MPKVEYEGIKFDSQLEVDYYKHLKEDVSVVRFIYNNKIKYSIPLTSANKYTPDFIVEYEDRIEVIETKGYNQFSHLKDEVTHNFMLEYEQHYLDEFVSMNMGETSKQGVYRKIKKMGTHGFVDFDTKNPNSLAERYKRLKVETKELKKEIKDFNKYFEYFFKDKVTKKQVEWFNEFVKKKREEHL